MSEGSYFLAHCATEGTMNRKEKRVDAIIPVYRPGKEFDQLLEKLNHQSYPLHKIILMNTGEAPWKEAVEVSLRLLP